MSSPLTPATDLAQHRMSLELVAHGLHPETGSALHSSEIIHDPAVIRALFAAVRVLERLERREVWRKKRAQAGRATKKAAGQPWTTLEDDELRCEFRSRHSLGAIAAAHERSVGGISARLVRLGLVGSREEARRLSR